MTPSAAPASSTHTPESIDLGGGVTLGILATRHVPQIMEVTQLCRIVATPYLPRISARVTELKHIETHLRTLEVPGGGYVVHRGIWHQGWLIGLISPTIFPIDGLIEFDYLIPPSHRSLRVMHRIGGWLRRHYLIGLQYERLDLCCDVEDGFGSAVAYALGLPYELTMRSRCVYKDRVRDAFLFAITHNQLISRAERVTSPRGL
jgi:hypothetical protein